MSYLCRCFILITIELLMFLVVDKMLIFVRVNALVVVKRGSVNSSP